ncbi:hypothetical protein GH714_031971 [Hevea brasiliensis]|uniref:Phloem protein 2 n=1 Tax=Hevea brasiliensis TaxID=3981 RepID=A0A6A6KEI2_HEVBR|nr:hypothetical protein GH714_031971 [Hevea brasiliensis]
MSTNKPHHEAISKDVEKKQETLTWVFKPTVLNIVWGNDPRYWRMPTGKDSAAELLQVCWLEVTASINDQEIVKGRTYEIRFHVEMKEEAFGWNGCPVFMMAKIGKNGKYKWKRINLSNNYDNSFKKKYPEIAMDIQVVDDRDRTLYLACMKCGLADGREVWQLIRSKLEP